MAKDWSDHFKDSMDSVNLPVPSSLYTSAATALASISALISAMKVVATTKDAVTIGRLVTGARAVPLIEAAQLASLAELGTMASGVLAAGYVGALIGAAAYATEKTYLGWSDKLIDWSTANDDIKSLSATALRYGIKRSDLANVDYQAERPITRAARNQCNADQPSVQFVGWPTMKSSF